MSGRGKRSNMGHSLRGVALALCLVLLTLTGVFAEVPVGTEGAATGACGQLQRSSKQPEPDSAARLLAEEEIAKLAVRAEEPGKEVVGGALSREHLTYAVIALAAAVIVLIAK